MRLQLNIREIDFIKYNFGKQIEEMDIVKGLQLY